MPNKLCKDKAQAIARAYCDNGRVKSKALITCGYSEKYARTGEGTGTFDNPLVIEAIATIDAELSEKTEWDVAESERKLKAAYDLAEQCKQTSAMVSAVQAVNKMYGLDIDKGYKDDTKPLTDADREHYASLARKENIRLAKETG